MAAVTGTTQGLFSRVCFATLAVLLAAAVPGEAIGQPSPLQQLEQLSDQARTADEAHAEAAKVCDRAAMQQHLQTLNRLAREARQIAEAARAAGEFATIDPESAARLAAIIATRARVAAGRKPENCVEPASQPPEAPPPTGAMGANATAAQPPPSLRDQALTANLEHARAAERCDQAGMDRWLEELRRLERLARELLERARRFDRPGTAFNTGVSTREAELAEIQRILEAAFDRRRQPCPKHRQLRIQREQQQPRQGAFLLDRASEQLLAMHNTVRAEVGCPPLQWDPQLAAQAASYGPTLAQYGRPVHALRKGRETSRENLLQALPGTPVDRMVGVWIAERRNFVPGIFPNVSRTGNWADVGHYTQMVWRGTTHVGCAVHRGGRFDWLICRYSPPGNQDGKPVL